MGTYAFIEKLLAPMANNKFEAKDLVDYKKCVQFRKDNPKMAAWSEKLYK